MPGYRLYYLDDHGHIRVAPVEFAADDDAKAKAEAVKQARGRAGELWERGRRVAVFAAANPVELRSSAEAERLQG